MSLGWFFLSLFGWWVEREPSFQPSPPAFGDRSRRNALSHLDYPTQSLSASPRFFRSATMSSDGAGRPPTTHTRSASDGSYESLSHLSDPSASMSHLHPISRYEYGLPSPPVQLSQLGSMNEGSFASHQGSMSSNQGSFSTNPSSFFSHQESFSSYQGSLSSTQGSFASTQSSSSSSQASSSAHPAAFDPSPAFYHTTSLPNVPRRSHTHRPAHSLSMPATPSWFPYPSPSEPTVQYTPTAQKGLREGWLDRMAHRRQAISFETPAAETEAVEHTGGEWGSPGTNLGLGLC